jgi:hypothetical protein
MGQRIGGMLVIAAVLVSVSGAALIGRSKETVKQKSLYDRLAMKSDSSS